LIDLDGGIRALVAVYPSYLLRLPDAESKAQEYQRFVDDLKIAATLLKKPMRAAWRAPVLHRRFPEFHVPVMWIAQSPAHCILGRHP
jgi:hypothetical protein